MSNGIPKGITDDPKILWITDPWHTLDHARDTTLRLIEEAAKTGIEQYWCDVKSIRLENSHALMDVRRILSVAKGRGADDFRMGAPETQGPLEFTSLHYRTDPPVNLSYIHTLQILNLEFSRCPQVPCELVNPIEVLLSHNEKMEPAVTPGLFPKSLVASQWERLESFGRPLGKTVLKPLNEAQSHGIELLNWDSPSGSANAKRLLEEATQGFQQPVLLQEFLEGISEGESRLWFLDSHLIGCVKKHPVQGDFRVNMDAGSRVTPHEPTAQELRLISQISTRLQDLKIRLAAVDLIHGLITDYNFTSPGLIVQMEQVLNQNLAGTIISKLASRTNLSK